MKKIFTLVFVLALTVMFTVPVFAATEKDVINRAKAGVKVDGQIKKVPAQYIKLIEDYLAANTLTATQLGDALNRMDDAGKVWAETGIYNFGELPTSVRSQLISLAQSAARSVGATLNVTRNGIRVVDPSGRVFTVPINSALLDDIAPGSSIWKQTGADNTAEFIFWLSLTMIVLVVSVLAVQKIKNQKHESK
ncbi:MAG: hypothetical protein FWG69_03615 [Oscillospiraceae bacterium]|nr:hypothetical protein [Oscillospiraceae bacterium]